MVVQALAKVTFHKDYQWMMESISKINSFEKLGFQRADKPESDIRGGGMLGLIVLANFVTNF